MLPQLMELDFRSQNYRVFQLNATKALIENEAHILDLVRINRIVNFSEEFDSNPSSLLNH